MSDYDLQRNIVSAIKVVVDSELSRVTNTTSKIGVIQSDPIGFNCSVSIAGQDFDCQLPEHLHSWIQKGDIVIVQDLYGDGSKKMVTGKTGSVNPSPSIVFNDEATGKHISGRDIIVNDMGVRIEDAFGTIKEG